MIKKQTTARRVAEILDLSRSHDKRLAKLEERVPHRNDIPFQKFNRIMLKTEREIRELQDRLKKIELDRRRG